jgi:hypothetical protein
VTLSRSGNSCNVNFVLKNSSGTTLLNTTKTVANGATAAFLVGANKIRMLPLSSTTTISACPSNIAILANNAEVSFGASVTRSENESGNLVVFSKSGSIVTGDRTTVLPAPIAGKTTLGELGVTESSAAHGQATFQLKGVTLISASGGIGPDASLYNETEANAADRGTIKIDGTVIAGELKPNRSFYSGSNRVSGFSESEQNYWDGVKDDPNMALTLAESPNLAARVLEISTKQEDPGTAQRWADRASQVVNATEHFRN